MASTPNFGWNTPADTDLVKDGALAIRTLGNAIDASMVDLKGGTTGQVLAKQTNTDMDFQWVTQDDANAIQNAIVDAKGDLIAATANDTPARLAVGNNGDTLLADSSASTGLRWQEPKSQNVIINSSFDVWQRGTSFTGVAPYYSADRWVAVRGGAAAGATWSRQSASLTGFNYSMRVQRNSGNTSTNAIYLGYSMESADSFALAGKTVVLSFWAKVGANYSPTSSILKTEISTGTGTDQQKYVAGFTGDSTTTGVHTATTSWQRFSATATLSASGTEVAIGFYMEPTGTASTNDWFEVTGVQLEVGSVATPYRRMSGTLQGELAACQRYYYRINGNGSNGPWAIGYYYGTATAGAVWTLPVVMRTTPTFTPSSGTIATIYNNQSSGASTAITDNGGNNHTAFINFARTGVANTPASITFSSGYLEWSSEL